MFSDVVMSGGLDGYELAEQVELYHPKVKILLTSGYTEKANVSDEDRHKYLKTLVSKPYNPAQLAQAIKKALDSQ